MKPLDEESIGSNSSFKPSPTSKKEVRFAETTDAIVYEVCGPVLLYIVLGTDPRM